MSQLLRLRTKTAPLLLFVLLASFGLRLYRLADKSVWWDEGLAAWSARQSLADIARWTSADVHPPLYFWMLHAWRLGSGEGEFGLRYLSVLIGVLTVAATYRLGHEAGGRATGLLGAALIALSRFDVWWSQEMRMYALTALWAALALWATMRYWAHSRAQDGLLYVLYVTAGLYTLYLSVSVLVIANLVWLVAWLYGRRVGRVRWRALLRWAALQWTALVLFAPWLVYALRRMPTWSSASPVALDVFLRIYWTVLVLGIPTDVERYLWWTLPVLAIWVAGLAALWNRARRDRAIARNAALLTLGILLPAGVVYGVSLPRAAFFYSPQLAPRYLIVFAPSFYVLLAWGITSLGQSRYGADQRQRMARGYEGLASSRMPARERALSLLRLTLALLVLCVAGYGLWRYYPERILVDDYKALVATLHAYQRPGDAVVLYPDRDWPVFSYHHPGTWHKIPHALRVTAEAAETYVAPIWEAHEAIWLVTTPDAGVNDPQGEVPAWLGGRAAYSAEYRSSDKVLRFYARTQARAAVAGQLAPGTRPPQPFEAALGDGVRLAGYGQPVREYRHGDTIHLATYWQEAREGAQGEVGLVDARGAGCSLAEAVQRVLVSLPQPTSTGRLTRQQVDLVVPPDVPPGRYRTALRLLPDEQPLCLGKFTLRPWPRSGSGTISETAIGQPKRAGFEGGIGLLGYDLQESSALPGDTVSLTLYWQAQQPIERRYKVFTHLLGEVYNGARDSFLWGQRDNEPQAGARPTSTWRSGEVIADRYAIPLDAGAPPGVYSIEIGLYDPATLERLPVLDGRGQAVADHLVLTYITVK